ncbi:serine/threonine-protein kinase [Streptomyces sp. NL15-2K]|uniref:serine/threonine-protein kinase n=1 Tax=Streptomyces sp. NL15-2K TaxID=376149 RepID=UPI000FFA0FA2|nr:MULTISPECIES: serine/threonine-protein kinase [Actinomycetes]WKX11298.1 serine/threonine-protein kinase [Kutzneria buriramensis]GCB47283.1 serine/threonine protein kinase [Streptomyces sp. NL15-2K]
MLIAGRYRLHDPIGRGAMGEVWRGFDETLGRTVAVKLLLPQGSDPTSASRFRLEAQTAGRLNHPHVVGVYDFGEYDGRLFLVMELVEGDSLARHLTTAGPLPVEEVARIAAQAAAGLAAAHQQGIVHRDIKPANLLLDADGTLKIGDFGIARFVDDPSGALTTTGQIVGTSLYLAPERALGQNAGPASDVYALGCVLYQLLTGKPPFQADTAVAILHLHLDASPVSPRQLVAGLPPAFENYLLGLLAKQPQDRPAAQQVAQWFGGGAWQGRSEPLPAPESGSGSGSESVSVSGRKAGTGAGTGTAAYLASGPGVPSGSLPGDPSRLASDTGPATTYALPSNAGRPSRSRTSRRTARPGIRGFVTHRPKVVGTAAAVAVFLGAMLAGMLWFSPGNSSAERPATDTPGTTGPARPSATTPSDTPAGAPLSGISPSTASPSATEASASGASPTPTLPTATPTPTPTPTKEEKPTAEKQGEKAPDQPQGDEEDDEGDD